MDLSVAPPSDEAVQEILHGIIQRVMKKLVMLGILVQEQGQTDLAESDDDSEEARTLRTLHYPPGPSP